MTSIEKLQLSGVRSFNPDPAERQVIIFNKPLTVILGQNGAGKTTLIEALLHATTGEMPPGASGMDKSSFVYDPKVAHESEVKAQIRLSFTARSGQSVQVIRSFQSSVSKAGKTKKSTFTTLDSTIAVKDTESSRIQSATYRACDADRMVPELLGVTKPVLEYVIFCHQESVNWPLGPSSELKRIFDELFAATRYVAALEKLREVSKHYRAQQKQTESLIIALKEHRTQSRWMSSEITQKQKELDDMNEHSKHLNPKINALTKLISQMQQLYTTVDDHSSTIAIQNSRIAEKESFISEMTIACEGQTPRFIGDNKHDNYTAEYCDSKLTESSNVLLSVCDEIKEVDGKIEKALKNIQELDLQVKKQQEEVNRVNLCNTKLPSDAIKFFR